MKFSSFALMSLLTISAAQAAPAFVNGIVIPGAMGDQFGTSVNEGRLGFFSDVYYDQVRNEWWALSDRGPGGGVLSYETRVQRFTLDIDKATGAISNFKILQTVKLTDHGVAFNGAKPKPPSALGHAFDPEGIVVSPATGNLLISDEYGPSVIEFDRSGALIKTFTTPDKLIPRDASGTPDYASDGNVSGRSQNRGFEGLAMSPDGKYLYAMLQSAMSDEGAGKGTFVRIVKFNVATGKSVYQYAYELDSADEGRGISALVALNDHQFLVLERNNRGVGVDKKTKVGPVSKKVYQIDLDKADDVTSIDLDDPKATFATVTKDATPFLDLAANTLPAFGNKVPEKFEALAIGPRLKDGSFLLLAGTDNDYSVTQNDSDKQFDVYVRFGDASPSGSSINCPLGQTTNCVFAASGDPAELTAEYVLLPGVLYGYKASAADLSAYVKPHAP